MLFGATGDKFDPTAEVCGEEVRREYVGMVVLGACTDENIVGIRPSLDDAVFVTLWIHNNLDEHTRDVRCFLRDHDHGLYQKVCRFRRSHSLRIFE